MRKMFIAAALAAVIGASAGAQSPSVVLQNQEDSTFYYVIDPKELAGLSAGSPLLASKVAGYFAAPESAVTFAALAPQAEARLTDLSEGVHVLVGFFAQLDADVFPVRVVSLQADSTAGERFYAVFANPAQLSVSRGVGKLAQFARPSAAGGTVVATAPTTGAGTGTGTGGTGAGTAATGTGTQAAVGTANPGTADSTLADIATFSTAYDPGVFTRESNAGFTVLPIAQSRSWKQTGTRIASLRGGMDSSGLKLSLIVPGGFAPAVSYFLYMFDNRAAGRENPVTLEIQPAARPDRGVCILWQKGAAPRLLGTVNTSGSSVELDVGADELASGVFAAAGTAPTVDLTAGWYDKALGVWEEFYYTTFEAPVATR